MADVFVRIDELAGYATSYEKLATDSATAETNAVSGFAAFVGAWGDDGPGAAVLGAYKDAATDAIDCVQQVPVQLAAISTAMKATADAYLGTETANTVLAKGATS